MTTADLRSTIDARRLALGYSSEFLASRAGLSPDTVRDYLSGRTDTRADRLLALCAALGLGLTVRPDPKFRPEEPPPASGLSRKKLAAKTK